MATVGYQDISLFINIPRVLYTTYERDALYISYCYVSGGCFVLLHFRGVVCDDVWCLMVLQVRYCKQKRKTSSYQITPINF